MRVATVFSIVALLGFVSAVPKGHGHGHGHLHRRGGRGGCICTKTIQASEATSQAGSGAVVYAADSSSSSSSDSGTWENGSGSESWDDNESGSSGSGTVQKVVYFNYFPVPVPMVTTCQTTGTIVIENDITINVTVAPTVITYTITSTSTQTETTTVTRGASSKSSGYVPASSNAAWPYSSNSPRPQSSSPSSSSTSPYNHPTPLPKSSWPDHKVIGYYGIGESVFMEPSAVPWDLLTHVCFAFGTINSDYSINITTGESLMSTVFSTALANGVKPVLSVGGWGFGSSMYSAMVSTNASRAAFVSSLHDLVDQYGITGIDIDWEYPGRPSDESVPYSPLDYINLVLLLQYLKAEFGDTLTISAAVAATTPYSEDISEMADLFDWVGLMFYDFATGPQTTTVSDSPLKGSVSAESGTEAWHEAGLPYDKMVFGIPSYGRSFTLVDFDSPLTNGINNNITSTLPQGDSDQSAGTGVWKWRNMISQGVLVNDGVPGVYVGAGDWTEEFDEGTVTPYVWNNVTGEFITYDDPVSISYKREYALSVGMQGMMVWEVAYDTDQGELMQYMN